MTGPPIASGPAVITLLTRSGCHLCEAARVVVADEARLAGVDWVEVDVDSDPELRADFGDLVPVVLVDGHRTCSLPGGPGQAARRAADASQKLRFFNVHGLCACVHK